MQKFWKMLKESTVEIFNLRSMVLTAMLTAMGVVLSFLSIYITESNKLSLTFIPISICAYLFGPVTAGFSGALIDILGYIIKPTGAYFPGFTATAFLVGFISGLFLYHKEITLLRSILCRLVIVVLLHILLNSVWLMILMDRAFIVGFVSRIIKNAILYPIEVVILYEIGVLFRRVLPRLPGLFHRQKTE